MTTARFLETLALGSLRDLPELDALDDAGERAPNDDLEAALDGAFGLSDEENADEDDASWAAFEVEPARSRSGCLKTLC